MKIGPEDLRAPKIEQRVREEREFERVREEVQKARSERGRQVERQRKKLRFSALLYLTAFGAAGALAGAVLAEAPYAAFAVKEHMVPMEAAQSLNAEIRQYVERGSQDLSRVSYSGLNGRVGSWTRAGRRPPAVMMLSYSKSAVWMGLIGVLLGFALCAADNLVVRNWVRLILDGSVGMLTGVLGGGAGAIIGNFIFTNILSGSSSGATVIAVRAISWTLCGAVLAAGPGVAMRSKEKIRNGLIGGAIGGLVGGLVFDPIGWATGSGLPSRVLGVLLLGGAIGVSLGIVERVLKSGWLDVVAGRLAGKQFVLYRNPTVIGSSPHADVYLFQDAQVGAEHAAIHRLGERFELEDLGSPGGTRVNGSPVTRTILQPGDEIQVGSTTFEYAERKAKGGA